MRWKTKRILFIALFLLLTGGVFFLSWLWQLHQTLQEDLRTRKFLPPTQYYSAPTLWNLPFAASALMLELRTRSYVEVSQSSPLLPREYRQTSLSECPEWSSNSQPGDLCLWVRAPAVPDPELEKRGVQKLWVRGGQVLAIQSAQGPETDFLLEPEILAQLIGAEPLQQKLVALGQVPTFCLRAVLAAEDSRFLEHPGVSWQGIARALRVNLLGARTQQGGSTITQQLVKNRFLNSERSFRRKWVEFWMSLLLEGLVSKDVILENYLNLIYMGQNGAYQIRGFGAAAEHYFAKPLARLSLGECASLAALLNSPGSLDPIKHPGRLLARRDRVLSRMLELGWIHEDERSQALAEALSPAPEFRPADSLPFALQAVRAELFERGITDPDLVFTSLQSVSQLRAQNSLQKQIENLEKSEPRLKRNKEQGKNLEGLALIVDVGSGQIEAVVGGRQFRQSQFNRALFAKRQIGSLMKPFVFLQALLAGKKASDVVEDSPFTHQWDRQSWSPVNYGGKYFGSVPLTFALANSLNCATARLSLDLGVEGLVQLMRQLGVNSDLQPVPSLSLGSFEISAFELAQAYLTLARFGEFQQISSLRGWVDREGEKHLSSRPSRRILPALIVSELVAMMQETLNSGTAQSIRALGWKEPGAGKTGTTSDFKDSWFAGFSAKKLVLVWLGYDDNTPTGLTGGRGAVPVWTEIQKGFPPPGDFSWPK